MRFLSLQRLLLFLFAISISLSSRGQITEVQIGINGLTCSQCSRSVEMRIRKLDFVKDVEMNLEHTEGKVYFKEHKKVDVDKIAQAVNDAGFSVRYLKGTFHFNHVAVSPNYCMDYNGDKLQFIQIPPEELNGNTDLRFIGDKYMPKKDLKKWQAYLKTSCGNGKTYYVTM